MPPDRLLPLTSLLHRRLGSWRSHWRVRAHSNSQGSVFKSYKKKMFYSCVQAAINAQRTAVVNVELAKTSRPRRVDLFVECTHTHTHLLSFFFYSYVCLTFFLFCRYQIGDAHARQCYCTFVKKTKKIHSVKK